MTLSFRDHGTHVGHSHFFSYPFYSVIAKVGRACSFLRKLEGKKDPVRAKAKKYKIVDFEVFKAARTANNLEGINFVHEEKDIEEFKEENMQIDQRAPKK